MSSRPRIVVDAPYRKSGAEVVSPRRFALNRNAKGIVCLLAAILLVNAVEASAATSVSAVATVRTLWAQSLPTKMSRQEAKQIMDRARQAIQQGNADLAEAYLARVEESGLSFNGLLRRFSETPQKIRQDIEALKTRQLDTVSSASTESSQLVQNPFASRDDTSTFLTTESGSQPGTTSASVVAAKDTLVQPAVVQNPFTSQMSARGNQFLLKSARIALTKGNLNQVSQLLDLARQKGQLQHPQTGDTVQNIEMLLQRQSQLMQGPNGQAPEVFNRQYQQHLLEQSEGLLLYGELDMAERLARQAETIPATIGQFGRSPQSVLQRIGSLRQQDTSSSVDSPAGMPATPFSGVSTPDDQTRRHALQLLAQAQAALDKGDLDNAQQMAKQARSVAPEKVYRSGDPRPWMLLMQVSKERQRRGLYESGSETSQIGDTIKASPAGFEIVTADGIQPATAVDLVSAGSQLSELSPTPLTTEERPTVSTFDNQSLDNDLAVDLIQQGEEALARNNSEAAKKYFRQAWAHEQNLDPLTRQRLEDHLQVVQARAKRPPQLQLADLSDGGFDELEPDNDKAMRRWVSEVSQEQIAAERQLQSDAKGAWNRLKEIRERVIASDLDARLRSQLLSGIDRSMEETEKYIEANRAKIELDAQNKSVLEEIDRRRRLKLDTQTNLAKLVDEFNELMDQQRYAEAVVLAKQGRELDPENPIVQNMLWKSRFAERLLVEFSLRERSQQGFDDVMANVIDSSIPFNDNSPIGFPDAKEWIDLSRSRQRLLREGRSRYNETELNIERALRQKVDARFVDQPLGEVIVALGKYAGINTYVDSQGLRAEGVTSDMAVTLDLPEQISLRSALNLILQPLRLSYVIQDEVLRITSEQTRDADVYTETYNVADLVIPIPNFNPSYNIGLPGAIREAHNVAHSSLGYGSLGGGVHHAPLAIANSEGAQTNASVLAQMNASGMLPSTGTPQPLGFGPGGMGGAAQADFDTLIELITTTISPTSWDEVGGPGAIQPFETNLSLVVSQTQEIHDQIADLLEQLRRLQDLQVTIEVRFITLSDNFFERIGIDFDFDIDDNVTTVPIDDEGPSVTIGLSPDGNPTADLDLSFTQGSFGSTVPTFGGFDAATAANFGFAILSDIEAFFVIQAAQGDSRTNVLQAPKVTLFNGQQAFVSDTSQRPFVTSVIPVVGDFAAAHQPVIVVLSEGTSLSVQAVVSQDRRFVRLTLVPFFSRIGDVDEFTFDGTTTSVTGTAVIDPTDENATMQNDAQVVTEGTTVQLPTFAFTTVSTTVSVPDGGTILLGGIKRLTEGRDERGVPILSKLPYVNRLFKNVGIGRTTQSLMMMVTPRIIIQEEEEERLGLPAATP